MFPDKVREILKSSKTACLGTVNAGEAYLSLMVFTFIEEEDILVMSSRLESSKVRNIQKNSRVSLLIHGDEATDHLLSISLSGIVRLEEGSQAEKYRLFHQQAHPQRAQFIMGEGIAILTFHPQRAVIADEQDQVTTWEHTTK